MTETGQQSQLATAQIQERPLTPTDYRFAASWCRIEAAKPYRAPMAPGLRAEADGYDRIADEMERSTADQPLAASRSEHPEPR